MAESDLEVELTDTRVRKWGRMRIGLSDYGAVGITPPTAPVDLFDGTTYKPKPFPAGVKELGYITTDGITASRSISANDTTMLQSLNPVRSDLESITKTLKGVFGESNAFTNALYHGLPVADWPASKDSAWLYQDSADQGEAEYVLWLAAVDGTAKNAFYRIELGYRVKVTATDDRTMSRSASEGFGVTFGFYVDPVVGSDLLRAEDGPSYATHLTYSPAP